MSLYGSDAKSQTFRTSDKQYSVIVKDYKNTDQITLAIKLYKGEEFHPTLTKQWDKYTKRFYYGGATNNFKFFSFASRDSSGSLSQMTISVFYYGNGYDKVFTEKLFEDVYYKSN